MPAAAQRHDIRCPVALDDYVATAFCMFITLLGIGSETLLEDFDAAGVEYAHRHPQPGVIMNAGEVVEILKFSVPAVAAIIVAWLNTRPSRKVTVTLKDKTIWQAEGRSVAEVEKLLTSAKTIMALETKKPDTHRK